METFNMKDLSINGPALYRAIYTYLVCLIFVAYLLIKVFLSTPIPVSVILFQLGGKAVLI